LAALLQTVGASRRDAYRQAGNYAGRIVKGEKPSELPVMLPTKFDLLINLKTAKSLRIDIVLKVLRTICPRPQYRRPCDP
jgi:putative ABC transport system substrate-binding protein